MSDRDKDLVKWLKQLLKFRESEYAQAQEFNGFSYEDDKAFVDESKKISDEIEKLEDASKKTDECECNALLTLDEAISHANEIAQCDNSACCQQHKQLVDWLTELKSIKDKYAYLVADFDNYKKRVAKAEVVAHDKAFKDVVLQFLNLYDDMERLYKEVQERASYDSDDNVEIDFGPVDSGFELIFENFEKTLKSLGCEKIEVGYGDKFDVNIMEALTTRAIRDDEGYDPDDVVEIFRAGWTMNCSSGKVVLRPTMVVVGKE